VTAAPTSQPVTADSAGRWEIVLQSTIEQPMRVAAFLDQNFGVTGGPSEAGKAHVTADGKSWSLSESSAECLFGLDIVSPQVIWECGLGPVRVSTDGALTWQAAADFGNYCRQLSFLDATTGWIASNNQLGKTSDGGATWVPVALPEQAKDIAAIHLRTPIDGYLLDVAGILYSTHDGGASWTASPVPMGLGTDTLPSAETSIAAVRFTDSDHGLVVVHRMDGSSSKVLAFRTADAGKTWTQEEVLDVPMLITLYLSPDGSVLTVADKNESNVTVLRYTSNP